MALSAYICCPQHGGPGGSDFLDGSSGLQAEAQTFFWPNLRSQHNFFHIYPHSIKQGTGQPRLQKRRLHKCMDMGNVVHWEESSVVFCMTSKKSWGIIKSPNLIVSRLWGSVSIKDPALMDLTKLYLLRSWTLLSLVEPPLSGKADSLLWIGKFYPWFPGQLSQQQQNPHLIILLLK